MICDELIEYVGAGAVPGGTNRNWDSYGHKVHVENEEHASFQRNILADPQTSGGLLISVDKDALGEVIEILNEHGLAKYTQPIGEMIETESFAITVV